MGYRILDLTLESATGLKKARFFRKNDVYAVAFISGTGGEIQKLRTSIDRNGDSNPTWNFPMKFTVDETAGLQNRQKLVVKIKAVGMFGDKNIGKVHVPMNELLDGVKAEGKAMQTVRYLVRRKSRKRKGVLYFSYKFGEKFSGTVVRSQPQVEYVQQSGYGSYPAPTSSVRHRKNDSGLMGFGTGLLGGLLLNAVIMSQDTGGGGC